MTSHKRRDSQDVWARGPRVMIVSFPLSSESIYQLSFDLVHVLQPIAQEVVLISGKVPRHHILAQPNVTVLDVHDKMPMWLTGHPWLAAVRWIARNIAIQVKLSWGALRLAGGVDVAIFFIGVPYLLGPMLMAKLRGAKVVWY